MLFTKVSVGIGFWNCKLEESDVLPTRLLVTYGKSILSEGISSTKAA